MKRLFTVLTVLFTMSCFGALPPIVRNQYTTNSNPRNTTNVLWLSETYGNDSVFVWGDPSQPVKTLTNALQQAQNTFTNSKATIIAQPESYNCIGHTQVILTNIDLTLISWGATFRAFTTNNPLNLIKISSGFRQFGGTWDYLSLGIDNQGHPMDGVEATNVHLFGVTVKGVLDNFFWISETRACNYLFDSCDFYSNWDMNMVTCSGLGTNSIFRYKRCSFTKNPELINVQFNAINMGNAGQLYVESCNFNADDVGNTNNILFLRMGRTNFIKSSTFSAVSSVGTIQHLDSAGTGPRLRAIQNCAFFPSLEPSSLAVLVGSTAAYSSGMYSNLFVLRGTLGSSNVPIPTIVVSNISFANTSAAPAVPITAAYLVVTNKTLNRAFAIPLTDWP